MCCMFHVYILKCSDGSVYIGQTGDLPRRLRQHEQGRVKWTRSRLPVILLKTKSFKTREAAVECERKLKSGFGRQWVKKHLL